MCGPNQGRKNNVFPRHLRAAQCLTVQYSLWNDLCRVKHQISDNTQSHINQEPSVNILNSERVLTLLTWFDSHHSSQAFNQTIALNFSSKLQTCFKMTFFYKTHLLASYVTTQKMEWLQRWRSEAILYWYYELQYEKITHKVIEEEED